LRSPVNWLAILNGDISLL